MADVLRRDRFVDAGALLIILVGLALYGHSQLRFRDIMRYSYHNPGPLGVSQLTAADHARYEANTAFGFVMAGGAIGVVAAVRHSRRKA